MTPPPPPEQRSGAMAKVKRCCAFAALTFVGRVVYRVPERWVRWMEGDR